MTCRFLIGDVRARMTQLNDATFDLILCSPPFLALRSYLPDSHPDKHLEIGSEATPAEFLDTMLALTAEWGRLLAPHGSIAIELGDTYCGAGGYGDPGSPNPAYGNGERFGERWDGRTAKRFKRNDDGWPEAKSLVCVPQLYQVALAYGRNVLRSPLSARELLDVCESWADLYPDITVPTLLAMMRDWIERYEEAGPTLEYERWRVRNLKPWIRSNPPVGALGDKERPATSYVIVATRNRDRYFDLDAVRTAPGFDSRQENYEANGARGAFHDHSNDGIGRNQEGRPFTGVSNPAGAPPRDWWHHVDATLDAELALRAGKPSANPAHSADTEGGGRPRLSPQEAGPVGAQGVHLRRALERAGILRTQEALDISPRGYSGAHYAVWPPELVKQLVDEMCPRRVCTTCQQPSRRIVVDRSAFDRQPELASHIKERREALGITSADINSWFGYKEIAKNWERTDRHGAAIPNPDDWLTLAEKLGLDRDRFDDLVLGDRHWTESTTEHVQHGTNGAKSAAHREGPSYTHRTTAIRSDLGWSDCGCEPPIICAECRDELPCSCGSTETAIYGDHWRPGRVLDPFVGSGTTLAVCSGMARDAVGIDLDPRNASLAAERVGMFLEIDQPPDRPTTDVIETL